MKKLLVFLFLLSTVSCFGQIQRLLRYKPNNSMKHITLIVTIFFFLSFAANADIIGSESIMFGAGAMSLEGAVGLEKPFTERNSAAIVGILGALSVVDEIDFVQKRQIAVEIKHYFKKNTFSGYNLGLNAGLHFFPGLLHNHNVDNDDNDNNLVGIVPGLTFSYAIKQGQFFQLEPYIEASTPWYSTSLADAFYDISNYEPTFLLTIGIRIGFNIFLKSGTKKEALMAK